MPRLTFDQLNKELRSKEIRPVYFLYGQESYLIQTALRMLKNTSSGDGGDVHIDRINGQGARWADIENAIKTVPMWSIKKVVHLSDVDKLLAGDQEGLATYLKQPLKEVTLILTASRLDLRTKFGQVVAGSAAVIECKPLYEEQLPAWINIESKGRGKQISKEAANYLAELVGSNLGEVANSLDKICLYVGDNKRLIEIGDIETVLTESSQKSVFELGNALGDKDLRRAMRVLGNLFSFGENPVMILNMLLRHWRILTRAKELTARKSVPDNNTLGGLLKVHPFFVKDYLRQSKNFSQLKLRSAFGTFWRADKALKSSRLPKKVIFEKLIAEICSRRPASTGD